MISKAFFNDFVTRKSTFYCGIYGLVSIYVAFLTCLLTINNNITLFEIFSLFYLICISFSGLFAIITSLIIFFLYLIPLIKDNKLSKKLYIFLFTSIIVIGSACSTMLTTLNQGGWILAPFFLLLCLPITTLLFVVPCIVLLKKEKNKDYRIKNTNLTNNKYYRFFIIFGYLHNIITFIAFLCIFFIFICT